MIRGFGYVADEVCRCHIHHLTDYCRSDNALVDILKYNVGISQRLSCREWFMLLCSSRSIDDSCGFILLVTELVWANVLQAQLDAFRKY